MIISVSISGALSTDDKRAAKHALTKVGIAIPATAGELKTAYEGVLAIISTDIIHAENIRVSLAIEEAKIDLSALKAALIDAPTKQKRDTAIAAALAVLA